jgi:transposase
VTQWSEHLLGDYLRGQGFGLSDATVGRILRGAILQPHRQKMWVTSHDEEFRAKRDDVLRVYYETPQNEHIICLDEKTGMQALERCNPDLPMEPGQPIRREFEYIRHGTLCLMGAYDVRRGKLFGFTAEKRGGDPFLDLLDVVDVCYPDGKGHIVMDNLSDHDTDEVNDWFEEHPRWTRHFTPKHASWLNQIENAFSILSSRVLARGSFCSREELEAKIYAYMIWHNQSDQPFKWSYRPKSWTNSARTFEGRH